MGVAQKKDIQLGFILLEALIAMSLIAGVWMATAQIYQGLALRQNKLQAHKAQLRKELDVFELSEHSRSKQYGTVNHESIRVPGRSPSVPSTPQPSLKNKRRFGS